MVFLRFSPISVSHRKSTPRTVTKVAQCTKSEEVQMKQKWLRKIIFASKSGATLPHKTIFKIFTFRTFPTWEDVMSGAVYMLAKQFSHEPNVRRMLRPIFRSRLKFSVYPTRKGRNEIDENHPLWNKHYIKDKMAAWLEKDEYLQYIKVHIPYYSNK